MLAYHPPLPLPKPIRARQRSVRRSFRPLPSSGPYRLPQDVRDRLTAALAPFRNRDAAFALATFLGRFWSMPSRMGGSFPIDRCALADRDDLGLTEGQIRGAIRLLEEIGFIDRAVTSGPKYRATEHGLRRKPIAFAFGSDYAPLFIAANRRAKSARNRQTPPGRLQAQQNARWASMVNSEASPPKLPENKIDPERALITGKKEPSGIPPKAFELNPILEAALENLQRAIGVARSA